MARSSQPERELSFTGSKSVLVCESEFGRAWHELAELTYRIDAYAGSLDELSTTMRVAAKGRDLSGLAKSSYSLAAGLLAGGWAIIQSQEPCSLEICRQMGELGIPVPQTTIAWALAGLIVAPSAGNVIRQIIPSNPTKELDRARADLAAIRTKVALGLQDVLDVKDSYTDVIMDAPWMDPSEERNAAYEMAKGHAEIMRRQFTDDLSPKLGRAAILLAREGVAEPKLA